MFVAFALRIAAASFFLMDSIVLMTVFSVLGS